MGGGPVVIQVGQCGNGVGASLWKHVAQELANGAHPRNLGASASEHTTPLPVTCPPIGGGDCLAGCHGLRV
jgi:hypothetical protein